MGIFDKLKNTVNIVKDSVLSVEDPTVKRYYDVILVLLSHVEYLSKENIKRYFKVKYSESCDDISLEKALLKFDLVTESIQDKSWYRLTSKQRENEKLNTSFLNKKEIIDICFNDYKNEVKYEFENILDKIKENPEKCFFDRELTKFKQSLKLPNNFDDPLAFVAGNAMGEVMIDRLISKDPTTIILVAEEVCNYMCTHKTLERAYALALRAQHFKSYTELGKGYVSITEDDCYHAAVNSPTYAEKAMESSSSKEFVIKRAANNIYNCEIVSSGYNSDWKTWAFKNSLFVDAACFYALKNMEDYFIYGDTTDIESSVNLIASYVSHKK